MKAVLIAIGVLPVLLSLQMKAGDTVRGKGVFERRCAGCHSLDADKEGPRLRGVYGRTSGGSSAFIYSDPFKKAKIKWDSVSLDRWLEDPEKVIPDTDMAFRLVDAGERKQVIDYLRTAR